MSEKPPENTKTIVQYKESGAMNFQCPILTSTNYTVWAIRIKTILQANGLWEMIEPTLETQVDARKDKMAIACLFQALPEDQILQVAKYTTARQVWEALKTRHVGVDRVQKAKLQTLKTEFEMMVMKDDETIDNFSGRLSGVASKANSLGTTFDDAILVRKLLNSVPERFLQIVASIEQYSDLDTITFEEAIGRLKTYEERIRSKKEKEDERNQLLFTHHEGSSNQGYNFRANRGRGRFQGTQGRGRGQFRGRMQGTWEGNNSFEDRKESSYGRNHDKAPKDLSQIQCFKCNKYGHYASQCGQDNQNQDESHLVLEDDEPALLLTISSDINNFVENDQD
jgi:hypothetical protein